MSDFDELIISTVAGLNEVARHVRRLEVGLQNVAPAQSAGQANQSIQYLQAVADVLEQAGKECAELGPAYLQESTDESQE